MPEGLRLFEGLGYVVEFDADFELTPAGFGDLEGLAVDGFDGLSTVVSVASNANP